jgi:hypothetical protein
MIAVFWKWLATKLDDLMNLHQYLYWLIAFSVYNIGWMKGLSSFPGDGLYFHIVFWFGIPWFILFAFLFLRAAGQTGRHL